MFDTYAYIQQLKAAGFTEDQAVAQAEALKIVLAELVTKDDLAREMAALRGEIKDVRGEIKDLGIILRQEIKNGDNALHSEIKAVEMALRQEIRDGDSALHSEIKAMEMALRQEIRDGDSALRDEIKDLEHRLVLKMGAMFVAAVSLLAVLIKVL